MGLAGSAMPLSCRHQAPPRQLCQPSLGLLSAEPWGLLAQQKPSRVGGTSGVKPMEGDKGFDTKAGRSAANQLGHGVLPFSLPSEGLQ